MRIQIIYLLLFTTSLCYTQSISGKVKDSVTQKNLKYANIVLMNGGGTYSDEKGEFNFDVKNNIYDTLMISSLGYKTKKIPLIKYKGVEKINLNVFLIPKVEELDEVVISSKKIEFKNKEKLGEDRNGNIGMSSLIGYETGILISNPKNLKGKIKRVYINLKRRKNADYIATFNIKFYEYDQKNNKPGNELYSKNIYIEPKNRKYRLWVDVEDFNIIFPENGICVGVEMVNTIGEVEKYAYFGPLFRYTLSSGNVKTWSNYHNTGWKGVTNKHKKYKNFKTGTSIPMIGVEVLYPEY